MKADPDIKELDRPTEPVPTQDPPPPLEQQQEAWIVFQLVFKSLVLLDPIFLRWNGSK